MINLQISCDSFGTKAAFIDGEVVPRFESYNVVLFNEKVKAALNRTVRAVRWHYAIDDAVGPPPTIRLVMQVRPKLLDYLFNITDLPHNFSL
jgi:hypothetical protein